MSDPPCAAAVTCEASEPAKALRLPSGFLPMLPRAALIASVPPLDAPRLRSVASTMGTPTAMAFRTADSGSPSAPASLADTVGVTASVIILRMSIPIFLECL